MLEKVKAAGLKAKEIAQNISKKAHEVAESEGFKKGVSLIKSNWDKIKNKRIKIEDKAEKVGETKK